MVWWAIAASVLSKMATSEEKPANPDPNLVDFDRAPSFAENMEDQTYSDVRLKDNISNERDLSVEEDIDLLKRSPEFKKDKDARKFVEGLMELKAKQKELEDFIESNKPTKRGE